MSTISLYDLFEGYRPISVDFTHFSRFEASVVSASGIHGVQVEEHHKLLRRPDFNFVSVPVVRPDFPVSPSEVSDPELGDEVIVTRGLVHLGDASRAGCGLKFGAGRAQRRVSGVRPWVDGIHVI